MGSGPSTKVLHAPGRKRRQQVAAICYRIGRRGVEFLLVQTRGGRWIFPKGGAEPGVTLAQSAALEAFEEAGVHGRIEEIPFARYSRSTPDTGVAEPAIAAYLCEVTRREAPQEANRNPTWFSTEKAKQRLRRDRAHNFGEELARIIDRAASRIERLRSGANGSASFELKDELQKVRFDFLEAGRLCEGSRRVTLVRHVLRQPGAQLPAIAAAEIKQRILRLGAGPDSPPDPARNVTAIDSALAAVPSRPRSTPSAKRRNAHE
ncbi:MAG: NUDIX domain-containing protein [Terriglobales bacterium]